jgi:hypothetical protein
MTTRQKEGVFSALLQATPSTLPQSTISISLDKAAAVAEANFIVRDTYLRFHSTPLPKRVDDEEQEWDILFALPHVQAGLSRLAEEAERQFAAGETEEGGFAVE